MKPRFTDSPQAWMRACRVYQTPADYASAVEQFTRRGHSIVPWAAVVCLCIAIYFGGIYA